MGPMMDIIEVIGETLTSSESLDLEASCKNLACSGPLDDDIRDRHHHPSFGCYCERSQKSAALCTSMP